MWRPRHISLATAGLCIILLAGCGGGAAPQRARAAPLSAALGHYLAQIEPIRLAVNRLLDRADPILEAFHQHRIPGAAAARRMGTLERRFATYAVDVAALQPANLELRALHAGYAQTYVLEDAYLSALTSGLASDELGHLPNTQSAQRAAIIRWRTGLTALAHIARLVLPADLQQAGRGEIAPSPGGS